MKIHKKVGTLLPTFYVYNMIRKLTLLNFFILTSFFVNAQHSMEGKVVGFENGTKVYILQQVDDESVKIDSTEIKNNSFKIESSSTPEIDLYYIELGTTQEYIFTFIMESGIIKFFFDKDNPSQVNVSGTTNNDLMTSYNKEAMQIQDEIIGFQNKNQKKFMEAQQKDDKETMQLLFDQVTKLQQKYIDQNINFCTTNKDSYITLLLIEQLSLSDAITLDQVKNLYNNLNTRIKDTKRGKLFLETIKKLEVSQKENEIKQQKIATGQKAPDFIANTPDGKPESLHKNLSSKATIIDFWASWCGPCRKENPNFVALYKKYKNKGLRIIGVSLDKEKHVWTKAIKQDNLDWLQVSNLQFWEDPIAVEYMVDAIPATFILDANGIIVAKDLKGAELDAKIAELLK